MASRIASFRSSAGAGRNLQRRKTRRGTRSCWACKRRKAKCTYARPTDDVCTGCARRCLDCVSQEFSEQDPGPSAKSRLVGDRIGRLESMIQQLAEQPGGQIASARPQHQSLFQALLAVYPSPSDLCIIGGTGETLALYYPLAWETASLQLLEKRAADEAESLWGTTQQQHQPQQEEGHPTLMARQLLLLAGILQYLISAESKSSSRTDRNNSNINKKHPQLAGLSQPPQVLARRMAEAATTLVTAHDRWTTGSREGLECLWLEALYEEHNGSLHQAWLTYRRAISAMHLIGARGRQFSSFAALTQKSRRQQDDAAADWQQMWFRLVHCELALCLVLDLPSSSALVPKAVDASASGMDAGIAEEDTADHIHVGKLERRHVAIANRLLARKELDAKNMTDKDAAQQIQADLEDASSAMPSGWWNAPNTSNNDGGEALTADNRQQFAALMKLKAQIFHFYLVILTNLPPLLQETCGEPTCTVTAATATINEEHQPRGQFDHGLSHQVEKCRRTCVEASRNLLCRFIYLRSGRERLAGSCFRLLDHYAWLAAVTLLLAHLLDSRQTSMAASSGGTYGQSSQHHSDRTMVSEAMERMRLADDEDDEKDGEDGLFAIDGNESRLHLTAATAISGIKDVLPRLLTLVAVETAVAMTYCTPGGAFSGRSRVHPVEGNQETLVLRLPSVGFVTIAPGTMRRGDTAEEGCSLLSESVSWFSFTLDDEALPQGLDGDDKQGDEEEEEEGEDEDEVGLNKAMKLWSSTRWSLAPYMLRP